VHLAAPFCRQHDQVAGLVQKRVNGRVHACIDVGTDDAGLLVAPEAAGNRCIIVNCMQAQPVLLQQVSGHLEVELTKAHHRAGRGA
jgi:hypothetical protein